MFDPTLKRWFKDPTFWIAEALSVPGEADLVQETYHALQTGSFQWQSFVGALAVVPIALWVRGHMQLRVESVNAAARVDSIGSSSAVADLRGYMNDHLEAISDALGDLASDSHGHSAQLETLRTQQTNILGTVLVADPAKAAQKASPDRTPTVAAGAGATAAAVATPTVPA